MYKQAIVNNLIKIAWTISPGALIHQRRRGKAFAKALETKDIGGAVEKLRAPRLPDNYYDPGFTYNGFSPTKPNNVIMRIADNLHNQFLLAKAWSSGAKAGKRYGKAYPFGRGKLSVEQVPISEINNM